MQGVNWELIGQLAQALFTALIAFYTWTSDRRRAHRDQLEALRADVDRRLTKLETRVEHLPTSDQVSQIQSTVTALRAQMEAARDSMTVVNDRTRRIEEFLLEHSPGRSR